MDKPVKMNYPPAYVLEYVKKWAKQSKTAKNNGPAEIAMIDDIVAMVTIAKGVMVESPKPTK